MSGFMNMGSEKIKILEQNGKYESYHNGKITKCPLGSLNSKGHGLILQDIKPEDISPCCNAGGKYGLKKYKCCFQRSKSFQ